MTICQIWKEKIIRNNNLVKCVICVVYLSSFPILCEVNNFELLPTANHIATFKATSTLLIYIDTKDLKQSAKYVRSGVPDIFWHYGLNPN